MSGDVQQYISADDMIREVGADPEDDEDIPVEFCNQLILQVSLQVNLISRLDALSFFFATSHHHGVFAMELA